MSVIDYDDVIYMDALSESLLMLDSVYHGALIQYKGLYYSLYAQVERSSLSCYSPSH